MTLAELWGLQRGELVRRNDGATAAVVREAIATDAEPFVRIRVDKLCGHLFDGNNYATIQEGEESRWEKL
jgi:hypothetical protein